MEVLPYLHPLLGLLALGLSFLVFRDGYALRRQRLRRWKAADGRRSRHLRWAPWSVGAMVLTATGGLGSGVLLRDWKPFETVHGWVGMSSAGLFVVLWWLGQRLVAKDKKWAQLHGVLGLLALFVGGLTGVLGIALLP